MDTKMINQIPKVGTKLVTNSCIAPESECIGMCVARKHLEARRINSYGVYIGLVPGCGGDVWWVQHGPDNVAAYVFDEITL